MTQYTQAQYDRVARRLDGEDISLSPPEQRLAQALADQQAPLGSLDVPLPPGALERAQRQVELALARPGRYMLLKFWPIGALAAAAAIALAVGLTLHQDPGPRSTSGGTLAGPEPTVDVLILAMEQPTDLAELDLLDQQVDALATEMVLSDVAEPTTLQLRAVESQLEEILSDPLIPDWSATDAL